MRTLLGLLGGLALSSIAACGASQNHVPSSQSELAPLATFEQMPSGVALWGERVFLSFPRWSSGDAPTVAEWVNGELVAFPSSAANDHTAGSAAMHSVNGLHVDRHGRLWMLDNGRVDLGAAIAGSPKVVVWDLQRNEEAFRIEFDESIAPLAGSFLNDLAVDLDHGAVYITESGIGGTPALIVHDIATGNTRRVLDGHSSVLPEFGLRVRDETVTVTLGGSEREWRIGANSLVLSDDAATLFYGATTSPTAYAIPTSALRDPTLQTEWVETRVRVAATKNHSDGMTLCGGQLVWASPEAGGVCVGTSDEPLCVELPGRPFSVGVECDGDHVMVTSAPLHQMPILHAGDDRRDAANHLWRVPMPEAQP